jgi:hypothetical protein
MGALRQLYKQTEPSDVLITARLTQLQEIYGEFAVAAQMQRGLDFVYNAEIHRHLCNLANTYGMLATRQVWHIICYGRSEF